MNVVENQSVSLAVIGSQIYDLGPTSSECTQTCDTGPTSSECTQICDTGPTSSECTQTCDTGPTSSECTQTCASALMSSRQNFVAPPQGQHQSQAYQSAPAFLC